MQGKRRMKDLLRTADLSREDFFLVLDLAERVKTDPARHHNDLRGEAVVLYFDTPSTRTRLSFEAAVARMGGLPIVIEPGELEMGETIEDAARVLSRFARAIVCRTPSDHDLRRMAGAAGVPVINGMSDLHHPCQSLADIMTVSERFDSLAQVQLAYVGTASNTLNSLLEACALAGVDLAVATPVQHEPDAGVMSTARLLARHSGSRLRVGHDPVEAVTDAHALFTHPWCERDGELVDLQRFRVTAELMAAAHPAAMFFHCLPAHRGEEVTSEVIDGPRSAVWDQAENRLYTAHALLHALVTGMTEGAANGDPPEHRFMVRGSP